MEIKSLEELKQENAAKEENATEAPQADVAELEVDAVDDENQTDDTEADTVDDVDRESETEAWMQTDEQASENNDQGVPVAKHVQIKHKLKATIGEQNDELVQLRQRLAQYESGQATQAPSQAIQPAQAQPAPTLEQFDYDEAKHQQALVEWSDARIDAKLSAHTQTAQQSAQIQQAQQQLNSAVDDHYARAEKLVNESGISPELYQSADLQVKQMFESVAPGKGELITNQMFKALGPGSEKVSYYLGRNPAECDRIRSLMLSDPSGISATMALGELKAKVTAPTKRRTNAPAPAAKAKGGSNKTQTAQERALVKNYQKAVSPQARFDARRALKQAGVNPDKI